MQCQHLTKRNQPCKNEVIGDTNYCYLKSHHPCPNTYEITSEKLLEQFKYSHEDPSNFEVCDVEGDGACLYRSLSQALYKRLGTLKEHPLYDSISTILEGEDTMFLSNHAETEMAIFLQKTLKDWLYENQDDVMKPLGLNIKDFVETTHVMSMDIYRIIYDIFAGNPDFLMVQKNGVHSVKKIPFRWGGSPEQYAFTNIFGFSVNIYDLITIDRRKFTIKPANFRHKIKRLRLLQSFEGTDDNTVNLYYTEIKGMPHYMYLHSE